MAKGKGMRKDKGQSKKKGQPKKKPPFVVVGLDTAKLGSDARKVEQRKDFKQVLTAVAESRLGKLPKKLAVDGEFLERDVTKQEAKAILQDFLTTNKGGDRTIVTNGGPVGRCRYTPTGWVREFSFTVVDTSRKALWTCYDTVKEYEHAKRRGKKIGKGRLQLLRLKIQMIVVDHLKI